MTSGMEMAAALYRLIYGTREAVVMMCKSSTGILIVIGRLFNKSSTVHTGAQSLLNREKHYKASDAFIVVMIVVETQKERRDAVIQLKLFLQLLQNNSRIKMMETKSVPVTKRMVWEAYKRVRANNGAAGMDAITITKFEEK